MLQLKIAIQSATLRQPFRQAIDLVAQLGAEGIEIDLRNELNLADLSRTAIRQIRKLLDDRKLKVASLRFPTRNGYHTPDGLDRRVDATKRAMQLAFDLGGSFVCNSLGPIPPEEDPGWGILVTVLHDLARHGTKVGARLAATTAEASGEELARVLAAIPAGGLAIDFDPAAQILAGYQPDQVVREVGEAIVHVRARDAVRDTSRRGGIEVQLGRGSVDLPDLLSRLEEKQYQGYLTLQRDESDDPLVEIGQGVEYLKNLWR